MKKLKLGMLLCFAVFLLGGCQIYSVVKDATDREEGRVVMKDGTEYVGRVKMPKCNTKTVRMKTADGQKLKLKNTDIEVLGVWKKTHTDKCHFLVCHPYKTNKMFSTKKEKIIKPQWMALEAQGDHVEFYSCSYSDYQRCGRRHLLCGAQGGRGIRAHYRLQRQRQQILAQPAREVPRGRPGLVRKA